MFTTVIIFFEKIFFYYAVKLRSRVVFLHSENNGAVDALESYFDSNVRIMIGGRRADSHLHSAER